jgi:hypothetical protein
MDPLLCGGFARTLLSTLCNRNGVRLLHGFVAHTPGEVGEEFYRGWTQSGVKKEFEAPPPPPPLGEAVLVGDHILSSIYTA